MYRFVILCVVLWGFSTHTYAQIALPVLSSSVTLTTTSDMHPGATVRVRAESTTLDLSLYTVRWTLNGSTIGEGVGLTEKEVTLSATGEQASVVVYVLSDDLFVTQTHVVLTPASVDIVWESTGYTHPFYEGRALPTRGAHIQAEAYPHIPNSAGSVLPRTQLNYQWFLNGIPVSRASGLGAFAATVPLNAFSGGSVLSVRVTTPDKSIVTEKKVYIPVEEPRLNLYKVDPLLGVDFRNAISTGSRVGDSEATFTLIPYFLEVENLQSTQASVVWSVNGTSVDPHSKDPYSLTLVSPEAGTVALIHAEVSRPASFEVVESRWRVFFEEAEAQIQNLFSRPIQ